MNSRAEVEKPEGNDIKTSAPKKVGDTAKLTLAAKYVTSQPIFWKQKGWGDRETPLTKNDCANIFFTQEEVEKMAKNPLVEKLKTASTRERWINKLYQKYIKENNYKQIVILGAGFDMRAYKKSSKVKKDKKNSACYSKVKFWELDNTEILDEKEKIFAANDYDKNAVYIKTDYTKDNFMQELIANGLDSSQPVLVIWEGNLMYLEKEQVTAVINALKYSLTSFVITFDYFTQSFVDSIDPQSPFKKLCKTGIDNIAEFALLHELSILDNRNIGDLEIEYRVDNRHTIGAENYAICAMRKV